MTSKASRRTIGYVAIASLIIRLALITVFAPMGQVALSASAANAGSAGSGVELVMCSVHGLMKLDAGTPDDVDGQANNDDQKPRFCPFCAGISSLAWALEPAAPVFIHPATERQFLLPPLVRVAHNLDTPQPTARGPPTFQI